MEKLARYVQSRELANGKTAYYFSPPPDILRAGVVRPEPLGHDRERARLRAMHLNNQIDKYREQGKADTNQKIIVKDTVDELFDKYLRSRYFTLDIKGVTQGEYRRTLARCAEIEIEGYRFGSLRLSELKHRFGDDLYEIILQEHGVVAGSRAVVVLRRVFNIGLRWDMNIVNPFTKLRVKQPKPRTQVWTPEQVEAFCDAAVDMDRLSVARVMRLAYDVAQRRIDLIRLKKCNFDAETGVLTLVQSKTGTEVNIPINPLYHPWFTELVKEDSWVFLNERTKMPYTPRGFTQTVRDICRKAGLSDDLQFRDIRRTTATEMGNAGCTMDEIMAVTGHRSRQTLNVYVRQTQKQAANSVNKLKEFRRERND